MDLKKKNIIIIIACSLALIIIGVSYAFFAINGGNKAETDVDATSDYSSSLNFIEGEPISLLMNIDNFSQDHGSLTDETNPKVFLRSEDDGVLRSIDYQVYFYIEKNTFIYTTDTKEPEIILEITNPEGNKVTSLTGLEYKTVTDYKTNTEISGFDITTEEGYINISESYNISSTSASTGTTQDWIFKVTLINLNSVQTANEGREFKSNIMIGEIDYDFCENEHEFIFEYTGAEQTLTVPETCMYKVELWGAQGGSDGINIGGYGAYVQGNIVLTETENIYIQVGQQGKLATVDNDANSGGYNGGGISGLSDSTPPNNGGGGGATDLRISSGAWNNALSLRSRIMVAGAGSGISNWYIRIPNASPAGGLIGYAGQFMRSSGNYTYTNAIGGTQIAGGNRAIGGSWSIASTNGGFGYGGRAQSSYGSGGGSGYYGGGGGEANSAVVGSGAGGSSYISGHTGSVAITSESSTTPKSGCTTGTSNNDCSVHYSNKVFADTIMIDGNGYSWSNVKENQVQMPNPDGTLNPIGVGHSGNGYAKITSINLK